MNLFNTLISGWQDPDGHAHRRRGRFAVEGSGVWGACAGPSP